MTVGDRTAFVLGTWFGCGRAEKSAWHHTAWCGACPHSPLSQRGIGVHLAVIAFTDRGGHLGVAHRMAEVLAQEDPQRVVIDEVAGVLIAMAFVRGQSPFAAVAAFVLFRLLDITKPGIIGKAESAKPVGWVSASWRMILLAGLGAGIIARAGVWMIGLF